MKEPGMLAVMATVLAVLPPCAAAQQGQRAQQGQPRPAPSQPACADDADPAARASGALPARASLRPEPHRGSVVPANRVLSHAVTPSSRAMQAAREKDAERVADSSPGAAADCVPRTLQPDQDKR